MFNAPFSGTGHWAELVIVLAFIVVGIAWKYELFFGRRRRRRGSRDVELRTVRILTAQDREVAADAEHDLGDDLHRALREATPTNGQLGAVDRDDAAGRMWLPGIAWPENEREADGPHSIT